jgi:hypothetical protein
VNLFKVLRRRMKYMTQSGTRDSNPWHFVGIAMLDGMPGLKKIYAYYFYQQCKAICDIDLDSAMRGVGKGWKGGEMRGEYSIVKLNGLVARSPYLPSNTGCFKNIVVQFVHADLGFQGATF